MGNYRQAAGDGFDIVVASGGGSISSGGGNGGGGGGGAFRLLKLDEVR